MKRLRNILTGALLVLGALSPAVVQADSIPVTQDGLVAELDSMAQRDDVTPAEQEKNTVDVKEIVFGHIGDSVRMAHHCFWRNASHYSFACNFI